MMKITTSNLKSPDYTANHEIFVGTKTGSIKKITTGAENAFAQLNLQELSKLSNGSGITSLDWGNKDYSQFVVGRDSKHINFYDNETNTFTTTMEVKEKPVGVARYDGRVYIGCCNGEVYAPSLKENGPFIAGDHMNRMRQCPFKDNLLATGGKDRRNNLKVWDLESNICLFQSKNVRNNTLELEVPIWDSDVGFVDANCLATCSRYGYIRYYDIRTQRRPVREYISKEQTAFTSMRLYDQMTYVGVATGAMLAFDLRNLKHSVHKYKGFTGSVTDVVTDVTGKYVFTTSLDRFVRTHDAKTTELVYQCYVKSKATRLLVRDGIIKEEEVEDAENVEEQEENLDESNDCTITGVQQNESDGSDPEYDQMFDQMQKISGDEEDEEEEPVPAKRRKKVAQKNRKKMNKLKSKI